MSRPRQLSLAIIQPLDEWYYFPKRIAYQMILSQLQYQYQYDNSNLKHLIELHYHPRSLDPSFEHWAISRARDAWLADHLIRSLSQLGTPADKPARSPIKSHASSALLLSSQLLCIVTSWPNILSQRLLLWCAQLLCTARLLCIVTPTIVFCLCKRLRLWREGVKVKLTITIIALPVQTVAQTRATFGINIKGQLSLLYCSCSW